MSILFWLAILPSALLAYRVLSYDKIEKEPPSLLARLFGLGMLTCIPAAIIETIGSIPIEALVSSPRLVSMLTFLVLVPFAEEFVKLMALRTTYHNKEFNYTFDGIVYSVMVGLGFATLENILYVLDEGTYTIAIMRGLLSVPMHCTCAVFMGYYYGVTKGLDVQGLHDREKAARRLTLAVPWIIHGFYDFALDLDSIVIFLAGLTMTIVVFILASRQVSFASKHDTPIVVGISEPAPETLPERVEFSEWGNKGTAPPPTGR